jgi:hypothetical protein
MIVGGASTARHATSTEADSRTMSCDASKFSTFATDEPGARGRTVAECPHVPAAAMPHNVVKFGRVRVLLGALVIPPCGSATEVEQAWSKVAARWTRTGYEAGRTSEQMIASPQPSRAGVVNPAGVRRRGPCPPRYAIMSPDPPCEVPLRRFVEMARKLYGYARVSTDGQRLNEQLTSGRRGVLREGR